MIINKHFKIFDIESGPPEDWIDIQQAIKLTGLCRNTFYVKVFQDNIPYKKVLSNKLFKRSDIVNYMNYHKVGNWENVDEEVIYEDKIDIKGLSSLINIPYSSIYSFVKLKEIPHFKYNTKIIFSKDFIIKQLLTDNQE